MLTRVISVCVSVGFGDIMIAQDILWRHLETSFETDLERHLKTKVIMRYPDLSSDVIRDFNTEPYFYAAALQCSFKHERLKYAFITKPSVSTCLEAKKNPEFFLHKLKWNDFMFCLWFWNNTNQLSRKHLKRLLLRHIPTTNLSFWVHFIIVTSLLLKQFCCVRLISAFGILNED